MKYENVKIGYELLESGAIAPTRNYKGDAGLDFYPLYNYFIPPRNFRVVHTAITVKLPDGYNGLLKPKGSSCHLVGSGVIENNYQGEILFKIFNATDDTICLRREDAIGQMILLIALSPEPVLCRDIHKVKTNRGDSGGIKEDKFEKQILKDLGY